jgi:hypothetical protein
MRGKLSMLVDFLRPKQDVEPLPITETLPEDKAKAPEPSGPLPVESPLVQRRLKDFFQTEYWPYVKEIIIRDIIIYQTRVDKDLQGSLSDPRDTGASLVRYHGGRIRGAEEIKLIVERLKKNYG